MNLKPKKYSLFDKNFTKVLSLIFCLIFSCNLNSYADILIEAYKKNGDYNIDDCAAASVLYLPIAHKDVTSIEIEDSKDQFIDLDKINHPRIVSMHKILKKKNPYEGSSMCRKGLYLCLLDCLKYLPENLGIAYAVVWRPLERQKMLFDQGIIKRYKIYKNWEKAYEENCTYISPFIDNIPAHCTGAAIDMTLFEIQPSGKIDLMDLGVFATSDMRTHQEQTFATKITKKQKKNRALLINATAKAGLVNYGFEWWHYSYGDKAWAYVKKKKIAIYGLKSNNSELLNMKKEEYLYGFKTSHNKKR